MGRWRREAKREGKSSKTISPYVVRKPEHMFRFSEKKSTAWERNAQGQTKVDKRSQLERKDGIKESLCHSQTGGASYGSSWV